MKKIVFQGLNFFYNNKIHKFFLFFEQHYCVYYETMYLVKYVVHSYLAVQSASGSPVHTSVCTQELVGSSHKYIGTYLMRHVS